MGKRFHNRKLCLYIVFYWRKQISPQLPLLAWWRHVTRGDPPFLTCGKHTPLRGLLGAYRSCLATTPAAHCLCVLCPQLPPRSFRLTSEDGEWVWPPTSAEPETCSVLPVSTAVASVAQSLRKTPTTDFEAELHPCRWAGKRVCLPLG